jgi:chromosome segregation ATPase
MSDETTATVSQADTDATHLTPQAGDTTSTPSQADDSQKAQQKSAADYERMIADLRKENANHRTRLKTLEADEAKRTEAQLSKEQLLEKQYNELKTQHTEFVEAQFERSINHEVSMQAAKLGVNPAHIDKVAKLIDWGEIDIDEQSGSAKNIRELVEQVLKDMPELRGKGVAAPTSGGTTNPQRSTTTAPQELSWSVLGNMKADEYAARAAEIQRWIIAHPPGYGQRR